MDEPGVNVPKPEKDLLQWTAASRPFKPLDRQLFATGIIIAVLVSIISAFAGEWMLIAVIVAIVFAYYMWSTVAPEDTQYVLTTRGVRAHGQLYLWQELTRWWIEDKGGHKMLMIDSPLNFPKRLHLLLGSLDEKTVENIMGTYLLQEKPLETPLDKAGRWLADKFPLQAR